MVASSAVEVEVARRALFEPESIVLWGVLEELGRLLEYVLFDPRLLLQGAFNIPLDCFVADSAITNGRRRRLAVLG
jgi:hypothetical protein